MNRMTKPLIIMSAALLSVCSAPGPAAEAAPFRVQRCVNMGNALDAPTEGAWGHKIDLQNFARIRAAGFDTVRIPVRWSAHLRPQNQIDPAFLTRVDDVLSAALAADLKIVLNVHHFEEMMEEPAAYYKTFLDIWDQLALHYRALPETVSFEVMNEPNGAMKGATMRRFQLDAMARIRQTNPSRTLILGGENWSGLDSLDTNLQTDDPNVVYTFHYYQPFDFTHQNAPWTGPDGPKGTKSWGKAGERKRVNTHMRQAARFARQSGRPVFLGEFGAYEAAPEAARLAYLQSVRSEAEAAGIGWCVWNFTATFPVFDDDRKTWVPGHLQALGLPQR